MKKTYLRLENYFDKEQVELAKDMTLHLYNIVHFHFSELPALAFLVGVVAILPLLTLFWGSPFGSGWLSPPEILRAALIGAFMLAAAFYLFGMLVIVHPARRKLVKYLLTGEPGRRSMARQIIIRIFVLDPDLKTTAGRRITSIVDD